MATSSWPSSLQRTPANQREEYTEGPGFQVEESKALRKIESGLDRLGAEQVDIQVLSPEVVVTYVLDGEEKVLGSDDYDNVRDNAQAIAKYIGKKRAIDRYGVKTPQDEWANANLPANYQGEEGSGGLFEGLTSTIGGLLGGKSQKEVNEEVEGRGLEDSEARMILGVDPDASEDEIENAVRERVKELHPDKGGDEDQFKAVMNAKSELID